MEHDPYIQSIDQLHTAHADLLQALFIPNTTYPIARTNDTRANLRDWKTANAFRVSTRTLRGSRNWGLEQIEKMREVEQLLEEFAPAEGTSLQDEDAFATTCFPNQSARLLMQAGRVMTSSVPPNHKC